MRISIVIPCHNAAAYVGQTIGSLLEQTRPPDEILVVADRCSDESAAIARRFGQAVQVQEVDFGLAGRTRNFGAAQCSGDAIMFLDADDVLAPEALAGLEAALQQKEGAVAVIPWKRLEQIEGKWVERRASAPPPRRNKDWLWNWLIGCYYPPCCLLWSRAAYYEVGGWSEEFCSNDDGDLANRALILGVPFIMAKAGEAYYRRIPGMASLSGARASPKGLSSRLRVVEKIVAWLEERERLDYYRYPLTQTIEDIRRDCQGEETAELRRRCDLLKARCGLGPLTWRLKRAGRAAGARRRIWWRRGNNALRRLHGSGKPGPAAENEIRFGLDCASRAMTAADSTAGGSNGHAELPAAAPVVSVVIPTYNRARLVARAVQSVLDQTFQDFEVLVIDDASTDNTEEVIGAFQDPRIRYVKQPMNRDVSAARNRGLREARGAFIAFLDSDDEWLPDKLARQLEVFDRSSDEVGLVYTGAVERDETGNEIASRPTRRGDVLEDILVSNITDKGSASVMIRRNVVRVVGFFDEAIPAMEDYDYWIRVARFYHFDYVEEPLVRYYEVKRADRRSLVRRSDIIARQRLFAKYRGVLKELGLTHKFFLVSSRRRLVRYQKPDRLGAFSLALRAVLSAPTDAESYQSVYRIIYPGKTLQKLSLRLRRPKSNSTASG